jgi:hypothetical protein
MASGIVELALNAMLKINSVLILIKDEAIALNVGP